jgi:hypothetical protein
MVHSYTPRTHTHTDRYAHGILIFWVYAILSHGTVVGSTIFWGELKQKSQVVSANNLFFAKRG